jgi:hypothetical protein
MAGYLRPGLAAESYFHFFDIDFSSQLEERLFPFVREQGQEFANEIFRFPHELSVELGPGGTKIWIRILTKVGKAIVYYGAFRTGIDYIVHDARTFTERAAVPIVQKLGSPELSRYRLERRVGIPGMLKHVIDDLDRLPSVWKRASVAERQLYFDEIQKQTERIFELVDSDDQQIIASGLESVARNTEPVLPPNHRELDEFLEFLRRRRRK